jgi:hypothetical protein
VSDIGDCDVALTLTAADGGRNLDLLFSARNGKWLAAGVDGRGRMNVERRTAPADGTTKSTKNTKGGTATATAQAGMPMVPAAGGTVTIEGVASRFFKTADKRKIGVICQNTFDVTAGHVERYFSLLVVMRTPYSAKRFAVHP